MLKWIAPIMLRLRSAPRPRLFSVTGHSPAAPDQATLGQRLAERVAALVGSWWFLGGQAFFLFLWLIYNTVQFTTHFDPPPYILLNLLLSFQAAFTGPVLLIAANVGAIRDHAQSNRMEKLVAQNEQLAEQSRDLTERLLSVEQMLESHIHSTLQEHSTQLADLCALMRAVHATVVAGPAQDGGQTVPAATAVPTDVAAPVTAPRPRSRSQRRGG